MNGTAGFDKEPDHDRTSVSRVRRENAHRQGRYYHERAGPGSVRIRRDVRASNRSGVGMSVLPSDQSVVQTHPYQRQTVSCIACETSFDISSIDLYACKTVTEPYAYGSLSKTRKVPAWKCPECNGVNLI